RFHFGQSPRPARRLLSRVVERSGLGFGNGRRPGLPDERSARRLPGLGRGKISEGSALARGDDRGQVPRPRGVARQSRGGRGQKPDRGGNRRRRSHVRPTDAVGAGGGGSRDAYAWRDYLRRTLPEACERAPVAGSQDGRVGGGLHAGNPWARTRRTRRWRRDGRDRRQADGPAHAITGRDGAERISAGKSRDSDRSVASTGNARDGARDV